MPIAYRQHREITSGAVMAEPFTIAANADEAGESNRADVALIYGAGPMGLTTVQALKGLYQVKTVIVVDRIEELPATGEAERR